MKQDPISVNNILDFQGAYLTHNYIAANHVDIGSESFLGNYQNYFYISVPIIIVGFIFGNLIFKLVYSYPIS